jgi:hypothetical protein
LNDEQTFITLWMFFFWIPTPFTNSYMGRSPRRSFGFSPSVFVFHWTLVKHLLLPKSETAFNKVAMRLSNAVRFVKPKGEAGELLLSLGNELILVVFYLARIAFSQKHGERIEVAVF